MVDEDPPPRDATAIPRAGLSSLVEKERKEIDDPGDGGNLIEISSDIAYGDNPSPRSGGGQEPPALEVEGRDHDPMLSKWIPTPENGPPPIPERRRSDMFPSTKATTRRRAKPPPAVADISSF